MGRTLSREELKAAALKLSEDDRFILSEELRATIPPDPDYERAWMDEIERRIADFDAGRTKGIPAEEVFRELRARLK